MRLAALLMIFLASAADAQSVEHVMTAYGAVVCDSPFSMKEARQAKADAAWLKRLGCLQVKPGLQGRIVDMAYHIDDYVLWKVHFDLPGTPGGATVWGDFLQFEGPNGEGLDAYGQLKK